LGACVNRSPFFGYGENMSWSKGYYTDTGYAHGFYSQLTPLSIYWAALIKGHILPIDKFRYIDMGCGQGYNLIMNAINHPEAEFVGLDLMPDHIQHATALAEYLGLKNISFFEFDFLTTDYEQLSIGKFDYIVAHGITTWVTKEVREGLSKIVDKAIKIGGVFYNSYNTPYYWQQIMSFQHLVRSFSKNNSGEASINKSIEYYDFINKLIPDFMDSNPHLRDKFKTFPKASKAYLVHEFCNQNWRLVFFDEEFEINSKIKLNYLGSMNLAEEFDQHYPQEFISRIAIENWMMQNIMKDTFLTKSFKQDIWIKGRAQATSKLILNELENLKIFPNFESPQYEANQSIKINAGPIKIETRNPIAHQILSKSRKQGFELSALDIDGNNFQEFIRLISLLIDSKYISLGKNISNISSKNKLDLLLSEVVDGKTYNFIPVANTSSAVALDTIGLIMFFASLDSSEKYKIIKDTIKLLEKRGNKIYDNDIEVSGDLLNQYLNTFYDDKFLKLREKLSLLGAF